MARKKKSDDMTFLGKVGSVCLVIGCIGVLATWSENKAAAVFWGLVLIGPSIWLFRADTRLKEKRKKRAIADYMIPQHVRILEDCLRLCQESKNAKTRIGRAELGIEKILAIEDLKPRTVQNRAELLRYFGAVVKCAEIESAYAKAVAAQTAKTREKNLDIARDLLRQAPVTDDDFEAAKALDPLSGTTLTTSAILATANPDAAVPEPETRVLPPVLPQALTSPMPRPASAARPAPAPPRKAKAARGKCASCWLAPGEATKVRGYAIADGMIYVGTTLPEVREYGDVDPALINPNLNVAKSRPDHPGEGMGYWPSYSRIPPACRAAYLEWLADGRKDPEAYIGYVFLYYYGLERRALIDAESDEEAAQELPAIRAEVERLLRIYRGNGSFRGYASGFLGLLAAREIGHWRDTEPRPWREGYELPLDMRLSIGLIAKCGDKLPVDWAFAWVTSDPEFRLRTPATRCQKEFEALFKRRYADAHGEGISLRVSKRTVPLEYHPASSSFGGTFRLKTEVPDVTGLVGPRRKLEEIVSRCCDELDPYSRWCGRNPGEIDSLEAVAFMPEAILDEHAPRSFTSFRSELHGLMGDDRQAVVSASPLLQNWLSRDGGRLKKKTSVEVAQLLARAGVGLVPDVRFGSQSISSSDPVVLYRLGEGDAEYSAPSPGFAAASLLIHLAAMVAAADGEIAEEERAKLEEHLATGLVLEDAERRRLRAQLERLLLQPPGVAGLKKRVELLPLEQRDAIAKFLVEVALADGRIDAGEVQVLTKIFRILDLDPATVHDALHHAQTSDAGAGPVLVSPAGAPRGGHKIPGRPSDADDRGQEPVAQPRSLDMAAVQAKLTETAAVASLLSGIFEEDDEQPTANAGASAPETTDGVEGLDAQHGALLRRLGERQSWASSDYAALADSLGLLPDGALEVLNEFAFDKCDAPLAEGEDPIEIDMDVFEELIQ
ncbi:MAG: TerB N-terminal domain-containing protein [Planctomycetes bacterium]|nr:TerB N-terminal domain-containing protein [Planctomycetota bacterium]